MSDIPLGEVVIVDDDEELLDTLEGFLTLRNCSVRKARDAEGCLRLFRAAAPDMAMIDLGLEDAEKDGIWLLQELQALEPDVPVVVLSGYERLEIGVRAMRIGAFDFIEKPIMPQYLFEVIKRTVAVGRGRRNNRRLSEALRPAPVRIAGSSFAAKVLADTLAQHAGSNCRVMVHGPPGAGKEHAARCIHHMSSRNAQPFVTVNCRAGPDEVIEKQMFGQTLNDGGYVPGRLEQVNGGTLYLEEVCALPQETQKKLLGALVRGSFQRAGGGGAVSGIDFRLISGTAQDIERRVEDGLFRKDLYDRLSVAAVHVPPLDARRDDIPDLCVHFAEEFHQNSSFARREFSEAAADALKSLRWEGNIRQLRNLVESVLLRQNGGQPVEADEISERNADSFIMSGSQIDELWKMTLREARSEFERQYLISQINRHGGNISIAAKSIGMERSALHRKLKGLEVETKYRSGGRVAGLRDAAK